MSVSLICTIYLFQFDLIVLPMLIIKLEIGFFFFSCSLYGSSSAASTSLYLCHPPLSHHLCISSFTTSISCLCGLPLFCLLGSSIFKILCPLYPRSLLCICPIHLILWSLISSQSAHHELHLWCSCLILPPTKHARADIETSEKKDKLGHECEALVLLTAGSDRECL